MLRFAGVAPYHQATADARWAQCSLRLELLATVPHGDQLPAVAHPLLGQPPGRALHVLSLYPCPHVPLVGLPGVGHARPQPRAWPTPSHVWPDPCRHTRSCQESAFKQLCCLPDLRRVHCCVLPQQLLRVPSTPPAALPSCQGPCHKPTPVVRQTCHQTTMLHLTPAQVSHSQTCELLELRCQDHLYCQSVSTPTCPVALPPAPR